MHVDAARRAIPERAAGVLHRRDGVGENDVQAFKIAPSGRAAVCTIKKDPRSRIQDTAITAEALLPDGPYNLWRKGETTHG